MSYNIEALMAKWSERDPFFRNVEGWKKFLAKHIKDKAIYLTDQVHGRPDVTEVSHEIMRSIFDFYKKPQKARNYRQIHFRDYHRPAWDSGGFQFLMGKLSLEQCNPLRTVEIYKSIGIQKHDFPLQLDLPPKYGLEEEETLALLKQSAEFYHIMVAEIPEVIGVVHGWTEEQLRQSLEWIEDPDKLAVATNIPTHARTKGKMTRGAGTNLSGSGGSQYVLSHITSNKTCVLGAGSFQGTTREKDWTMGHLNPHSSVLERVGVGAYNQSGMFVCDFIANTPSRMEKKVAAGTMADSPVVVDHVKSRPIAAGANQQSGMFVLDYAGNLKRKVVAAPGGDVSTYVMGHIGKKSPESQKPRGIPKKHRAPQKVVLERLATVLNMLRDRDLFILGGASPHFQHILFCAGAKYTDTSSWRLKAYMASIYLPEVGARSIGYKETDKRLREKEKRLLRECLRDPSHPFSGMSAHNFLMLGHMNVKGYYDTVEKKEWPAKPFDLRALHNAWVLKVREERRANEFGNDPDRYYRYLKNRRFKGHPQLAKRLGVIWKRMTQPYVSDDVAVYLKGR